MNVLMITFVYNEKKYLPHTLDYYKRNGCNVYILDNYSKDGTYEWLLENDIPCHRVNTNEEFSVNVLQKELMNTVHRLKPDWVIFGGADLYHVTKIPIAQYIEKIDSMGYNILHLPIISPLNTGEEYGLPLCDYYFNVIKDRTMPMIAKYEAGFNLFGDTMSLSNPRHYISNEGMSINYGACKTAEEQDAKLERTLKSWKSGGTNKGHSVHYPKGKQLNWIYPKSMTFDIRNSPYNEYLLKIKE